MLALEEFPQLADNALGTFWLHWRLESIIIRCRQRKLSNSLNLGLLGHGLSLSLPSSNLDLGFLLCLSLVIRIVQIRLRKLLVPLGPLTHRLRVISHRSRSISIVVRNQMLWQTSWVHHRLFPLRYTTCTHNQTNRRCHSRIHTWTACGWTRARERLYGRRVGVWIRVEPLLDAIHVLIISSWRL